MPALLARLSFPMVLLLSLSPAVAAPTLQAQLDALPNGEWLEYRVALQPGQRSPCCFEWQDKQIDTRGCRLQDKPGSYGTSDDQPVVAAGASLRILLQRGEQGLSRVLAVGEHCPVDAGTAKVRDIGEIATKASVEWLARRVEGEGRRQRGDALHALALHAGSAADVALERMAAKGRKHVRDDAVFWLAQARGERGFREVRRLLESVDDDSVGRLVFALSISPVAEAPAALRTLATDHPLAGTRSEALFWLAQKPDSQADAILSQAMRNDPDQDVRRKAVFATSQLPAERAVPILRALVEAKGESRELRKEALFWLAQIDDAAVIPVFDDLLGLGTH